MYDIYLGNGLVLLRFQQPICFLKIFASLTQKFSYLLECFKRFRLYDYLWTVIMKGSDFYMDSFFTCSRSALKYVYVFREVR